MKLNVRNNVLSLRADYDHMHHGKSCVIATEWDNGEGFDMGFYQDTEEKRIELHYDDILALDLIIQRIKEEWGG